ncbi:sigma E protease regulator RseP [Psychromonas sp. Urea-02u-13]|uniref:sigma E protease regulator RseP n=1 Tax=Psychromonas sp. Urea-02u-13 TaxID=2058326 RepID=UPI000C3234B5|nr:sigma E protease regulator RseP [Psychromonas sp. Urea-02u-13]PKG39912.1 zinc metallopeptidase RseP [Psychromonas sp. Urea-02u-13]
MLTMLWNLGAFIVALSILVAIHEYGHFWVARRCGVKVHRFSIGFGKVLFKRTDKQGTEFAIAAIPLGGYVKMLDGRVENVPEELQQFAFDKKTVWQRIAIVAAGPLANFALAIVAFCLMYMIGINTAKPIVKGVIADSPMSVITTDQRFQIMAINDRQVGDWEALNLALVSQIGENEFDITIKELTNNTIEPISSYRVSMESWKFDPKTESIINSLGLSPYRPVVHLQVAQVSQGGAGNDAGLKAQDKLLAIDGKALIDWADFVELIQTNANAQLALKIERDGKLSTLLLTPKLNADTNKGYIGVAPVVEPYPEEYRVTLQFGAFDAFVKGVEKTGQLTKLTFDTLIKLITGDISVKNLSGPVSIAKGAGASADYGIEYFLGFLALISVNLGLMNLIPLPVLDGGHLLYYFVEVLTGKPVPEKIQEFGFKIGGAVLMTLMTIAILNDFNLL